MKRSSRTDGICSAAGNIDMKVIITGANSYIGSHIQSYIQSVDEGSDVTQLDVADESWREKDYCHVQT